MRFGWNRQKTGKNIFFFSSTLVPISYRTQIIPNRQYLLLLLLLFLWVNDRCTKFCLVWLNFEFIHFLIIPESCAFQSADSYMNHFLAIFLEIRARDYTILFVLWYSVLVFSSTTNFTFFQRARFYFMTQTIQFQILCFGMISFFMNFLFKHWKWWRPPNDFIGKVLISVYKFIRFRKLFVLQI